MTHSDDHPDVEKGDGMWVCTTYDEADKSYKVTVEVESDYAVSLTPDTAFQYAQTLLNSVAMAEHDSAVFRQMMKVTKGVRALAAQMVIDNRKDRPETQAYGGLLFKPGVNDEGDPFVTVLLNDKPVGQFDMVSGRQHALAVMEAPFAADLDTTYLKTLKSTIGLDERSQNIVGDLANYRKSE